MKNKLIIGPTLLVLSGAILFSAKAILVKLMYIEEARTLDTLLLRLLFSLPFYIIIFFAYKKHNRTDKRENRTDYFKVVLAGFIGYYLASYFDFLGLQYITASFERLILFIYPTLVLFISAIFLKTMITSRQMLAIAVTYVGVFITFYNELNLYGQSEVWLGTTLIFFSALTYASYLVFSENLVPKFGTFRFTSMAMIVSTFCVIVHYLFSFGFEFPDYNWVVYGWALAMAVFCTVIPSFLITEGIRQIGASNAAVIASIGPFSTIVLAYLFLNEIITLWQLAGAAIVVLGIIIISKTKKRIQNQ